MIRTSSTSPALTRSTRSEPAEPAAPVRARFTIRRDATGGSSSTWTGCPGCLPGCTSTAKAP